MHLTPAEYVIHIFGGVRRTARAIGCSPTAIVGWRSPRLRKEQMGRVPTRAQRLVLEKAREMGLDLTAEDLIFGRDVQPPAETLVSIPFVQNVAEIAVKYK